MAWGTSTRDEEEMNLINLNKAAPTFSIFNYKIKSLVVKITPPNIIVQY